MTGSFLRSAGEHGKTFVSSDYKMPSQEETHLVARATEPLHSLVGTRKVPDKAVGSWPSDQPEPGVSMCFSL